MPRPTRDRSRRAVGAAAAAAALAVGGGGLLAYGFSQQESRTPPPAAAAEGGHAGHGGDASSTSGGSDGSASPSGSGHAGHHMGGSASPSATDGPAGTGYAKPAGETMERSEPARVRIPSLDVTSSVIDLGLQPDKRMEVPQDGTSTGWYDGSPTPGELGPSVLAAHVTWDKKPAVFFDLGSMKKGQEIEVERKDGSTGVFEVESIGQYPKAKFPTKDVYGTVDHAALRLITCGGYFDGETGHHVDNVVVYAKLVDTKKA